MASSPELRMLFDFVLEQLLARWPRLTITRRTSCIQMSDWVRTLHRIPANYDYFKRESARSKRRPIDSSLFCLRRMGGRMHARERETGTLKKKSLYLVTTVVFSLVHSLSRCPWVFELVEKSYLVHHQATCLLFNRRFLIFCQSDGASTMYTRISNPPTYAA